MRLADAGRRLAVGERQDKAARHALRNGIRDTIRECPQQGSLESRWLLGVCPPYAEGVQSLERSDPVATSMRPRIAKRRAVVVTEPLRQGARGQTDVDDLFASYPERAESRGQLGRRGPDAVDAKCRNPFEPTLDQR